MRACISSVLLTLMVVLSACGSDEPKQKFPGEYISGDRTINPDERREDGGRKWFPKRVGDNIEIYVYPRGRFPSPDAKPVLTYRKPLTAAQLRGDDPDCDTLTDEQAERAVENGDHYDLDRDGDGVPCE